MKIAIFDDEIRICRLIHKLIDWESLGFHFVGFAHDGLSGLALMRESRPDIVITDIRMPGLTGLELIEKSKNEGLNAKFVIISGYSQFEYAKNALQLDVSNYILKPVDEIELNNTLDKLKNEIIAFQSVDNMVIKQVDQLDYLAREKQLIAYFRNPKEDKTAFFGDQEIYFILYASYAKTHENMIAIQGENVTYGVMKNDAKSIDRLQALSNSGRLVYSKAPLSYFLEHQYERWFSNERILEIVEQKLAQHEVDDIFKESMPFILNSIEYLKKDELITSLDYLVKKLQMIEPLDAALVYHNLMKLIQSIAVQINAFQDEKGNAFIDNLKDKIEFEQTFEDVMTVLKNTLETILNTLQDKRVSAPIVNIKNYIDSHFTEDISLDKLADIFDLSPTYLSQLFKTEEGISYIEYLTQKRMNHARTLLKNLEHSIADICHMVGYMDQKHFAKTFKKHTNLSPSAYRKMYR